MKTKRLYKSTVSLLLVFMMLVSMFTVGIVNASAADFDYELVFKGSFNDWQHINLTGSNGVYSCNVTITTPTTNNNYYWAQILIDSSVYGSETIVDDVVTALPLTKNTNSGQFRWKVTTTGTYTITYNFNGGTISISNPNNTGTTDPTEEPTTPSGDPTSLTKLYFMDNSSDSYMDDYDADIYAAFDGGKKQQMKQRVDTKSGKTLWSIDIPDGSTSVTFYRYSKLGAEWGTWGSISLSDKTSGYYKASGGGSGSWESNETTFSPSSDDDITNFWYGVWVDSKGDAEGKDAVRWWKDSSGKYHIFLPSHTPANFNLYTSFNSFTVDGKTASKDNPVEISGITYDQNYAYTSSAGNGTIVFHKSANVSSLLFFTDDQLWTEKINVDDHKEYKDAIETSGKIYLYDEEGNLLDDGDNKHKLKKIKGRGNSSFEASTRMYGKYAYNFNLSKAASLIDDATKSKKWCLLANNVDHSMLRNTFAYALAADLGLDFSPKTRHVDVYDNGEYIGAYTIIEKVEYGDDTLMDGLVNLDDVHEGWYDAYNTTIGNTNYDDYDKEAIQSVGTKDDPKDYTTTSGGAYEYKYWESKIEGFTYEHNSAIDPATTEYNFVLEHELSDRYYDEASWFKAPSGQYVVVKYPEFATQNEMKWAMEMYDKMHQAAYTTKTETALKAAIDVESFAKVYLIQELGLNLDACATSFYMYNQGGKLVAGPVWDYDWSFGSYHKTKVTYNGTSSNLSNPKQMYVKDKDMYNNNSGTPKSQRNLQAQLTQTGYFWDVCQDIWTNDAVPAIKNYIDVDTNDGVDTGIMLTKWLSDYNSSVEMNNIRWNNVYSKDEGDLGDTKNGDGDWGTKLTADYDKGSYNFQTSIGTTSNSKDSREYSYANTVYYLNDWLKVRMEYMSDDGDLYDETLLENYEVADVKFTAVQSDDGSQVTVTPSATVTRNGVALSASEVQYTVYLNGNAVAGPFEFTTETATINLTHGMVNEVYVKVSPVADSSTSFTSSSEKFSYGVAVEMAQVTINFKSSGSFRYQPKINVNGNDVGSMTQGTDIGKNSSQTQAYYWYTATVELELGKATNVTFTNAYSMNATIAVTPTANVVVYHFAVDNLNNGTEVVDLSKYNTDKESDQAKLNFKQSASHMVDSSAYDPEPATTSINGTVYKMGDSDGDGIVTVLDATTTQMALANKIKLSAIGSAVTDYNLDGVPSILDVTLAQTYLAQ